MGTPSRKNASLDIDALLNTLSPVQVAESIRRFTAGLSPEAVSGIVASSLPRMDGFERTQLAIAFGARGDLGGPGSFAEPTFDDVPLLELVRAAGLSAPARFAQFLVQNVRSLRSLDPATAGAILMPFMPVTRGSVRFSPLDQTPQQARRAETPSPSRLLPIVAGLVLLAIAAVFAYRNSQRNAPRVASTRTLIIAPSPIIRPTRAAGVAPVPTAAPPSPVAAASVAPSAIPQASPTVAPSVAPSVSPTPRATPTASPLPSAKPSSVPSTSASPPLTSRNFEDRARATVIDYLTWSMKRGSRFSIVQSSFNGSAARVLVNIDAPDGQFLGEYTVMEKGASLEIVDESVSPR